MPEYLPMRQGSPEWFATRAGIPTASAFSRIMSARKDTRNRYLHELVAETILGGPMDRPWQTRPGGERGRGHVMEPRIREWYEFETGHSVEIVGFARNAIAGASPDGLVGDDGVFEAKSKLPDLMVPIALAGTSGGEFTAQVQGLLWVTERAWCDLVIYAEGIGAVIERVERDGAYIETLAERVTAFVAERDAMVQRLRAL